MKPEVAVILVLNLLPLHSLALLADASSSATGSHANPAADARTKNLHPVGSRIEARRKRSADYRNSDDGSRFGQPRGRPLSARGRRERPAEPNIVDGRWNDRDSSPPVVGHHLADWHPVSEMSWIRRRSPDPVEQRDGQLGDWSDTGMEWIKRRGDDDVERRHQETAAGGGSSWTKRLVDNDDGEHRGAADNWEGGFADIDWIKRHRGTHVDD